jgi:hypothetical protein
MGCNRLGIFKFGYEVAKWGNSKLKLRNEFPVELCKPDNFCNVPDKFRLRPVYKKLMLRHGRTVSVWTNIDSDKLKALGENAALL